MLDTLIAFLQALPQHRLVPLLSFAGGVLLCFILMELRTARWKRRCESLKVACGVLEERLQLERQHAAEKELLLERTAVEMRLQFKDLAQEIFDEKSSTFSRQNSEKLDLLLRPLQEQLSAFRNRVDTIFTEETRERASLRQEILLLRDLNQQINEEAINLTRALTGDRKLQGTWGELVLERLLEQSGLRKGCEYETQTGYRDSDNKLFKPDVIVHLPDGKDIVIDSKVSLSAWSRYVAAADEAESTAALSEHLQALRNHLKSLSLKDYSSLTGIKSLDFVLMFVPIDAAFMTALQAEERLITEMNVRKIIIVTPTTLLATLRTIEHIWQLERQNRNAVEIAGRASLLYDKLRGFVEDMERLGKQLDTCRDSYDSAISKMSRGRGNLLAQASLFPELGVQIKKELSGTIAAAGDNDPGPLLN